MGSMFRLVALTVGFTLGMNASALGQETKGKGDQKPKEGTILQIDISKLPPDLAKQLLDFAKKDKEKPRSSKKGDRNGVADAISLSEAIAIAEKAGKGKAINAQRKDGSDYTQFTVEIAMKDGGRIRYTLNHAGAVMQQRKYQKDRD